MLNNTGLMILIFPWCFVPNTMCQENILHALGNHGDRLSDLESKMVAIMATFGNLKTDLQRVADENAELKRQLEALKTGSSCICMTDKTSIKTPNLATNMSTSAVSMIIPSANISTSSITSNAIFPVSTSPTRLVSTKFSPDLTTRQSTSSSASTTISTTLFSTNGLAASFSKAQSAMPFSMTQSETQFTTTQIVTGTATQLATAFSSTNSATQFLTNKTSFTQESTTTAKPIYVDCNDAWSHGVKQSGAVLIRPEGMSTPLHVYCHMTSTDAWIVIQRRVHGNVTFNRAWGDYKRGFGDFDGDFWIGNELIHELTAREKNSTLYILLEDWSGSTRHAQYADFWIDNENEGYRLNVGAFLGDAGDSFNYPQSNALRHNHMKFSTRDKQNDRYFLNCALNLHGGWWFNQCYSSNLNGLYFNQPFGHRKIGEHYGTPTLKGTGIEWYPWKHKQYSLKFTEMRIRLG